MTVSIPEGQPSDPATAAATPPLPPAASPAECMVHDPGQAAPLPPPTVSRVPQAMDDVDNLLEGDASGSEVSAILADLLDTTTRRKTTADSIGPCQR